MPFAILLAVAVTLVYSNSFTVPFIFDDIPSIIENPTIRSLRPPWRAFWGPDETGVAGRPIVNFTFALNYAVSGLHVWSYHVANLAIHIANALLIYGIVRRTFKLALLRERWGGEAEAIARTVSLLWALHPLQTEAVTYVIPRNESLMAFFYLLTLYAFIRGLAAERPAAWQAAAVAACFLGMASKETMVTAPVIILLYDRCHATGAFGASLRARKRFYGALFASWILLGILVASGPRQQSTGFGLQHLGSLGYARVQAGVLVRYLRLTAWPSALVFDYGWVRGVSWGKAALPGTFILALLGAVVIALWRRPALGFWGAWFFVILSPSSSVLPITEAAWEYRVYLPLAGVAVLVTLAARGVLGAALRRFPASSPVRRWGPAAALGVVCLLLGGGSFARNREYRSVEELTRDSLKKWPENARALSNYGGMIYATGKKAEGIAYYEKALALMPGCTLALNLLGAARMDAGQIDEAVKCFNSVLAARPNHPVALVNLGLIHFRRGEIEKANDFFARAVKAKPLLADAHCNLAKTLYALGRSAEARAEVDEALRLKPDYQQARDLRDYMLKNPDFRPAGR